MKKQILIALFSVSLIFVSIKAYAILPALIFAETAIESFVIRSVATQTVATVATAANDASWAATFLSWLNGGLAVSTIVLMSPTSTYEVELSGDGGADLTYAPMSPNLFWRLNQSISANDSADNISHTPNLPYVASIDQAVLNWITWASVYLPNEIFTPLPCDVNIASSAGCPMQVYVGNKVFWTTQQSLDDAAFYGYVHPPGATSPMQFQEREETDNHKRILGTPGHWSADTTDPDWSAADIAQLTNVSALRFGGVTGSNSVLDFSAGVDGLNLKYQQAVSAGNVRQLSLSTDVNGVPFDVQVYQGAGAVVDPAAADATGTTPATGTIQFPNDYARAGEAAYAANILAPKLDTLHQDLSTTANVADPLDIDPATMPSFGTTFDNLRSFNLPAHASTCPAPEIDLSGVLGAGKVYQFNAHCQLVQDHFGALQASMMVVWSMLALFVVLRA